LFFQLFQELTANFAELPRC